MARINSDDLFYSYSPYTNWHISENIVNAIKEIKWSYKEGCYCDKVLATVESDNIDIVEKYRGELSSSDFYNRCGLALQFFTRHILFEDLNQDFIEKNNVKEYHIKLINKLYFDKREYRDCFDDELAPYNSIVISTADKRPFGNSYIEYDIYEIIEPRSFLNDYDDEVDINDELRKKCWRSYDEMLEILILLCKEFPMEFRNFDRISRKKTYPDYQSKYVNHNWIPSISEFRDIKLNKILNKNIK